MKQFAKIFLDATQNHLINRFLKDFLKFRPLLIHPLIILLLFDVENYKESKIMS